MRATCFVKEIPSWKEQMTPGDLSQRSKDYVSMLLRVSAFPKQCSGWNSIGLGLPEFVEVMRHITTHAARRGWYCFQ